MKKLITLAASLILCLSMVGCTITIPVDQEVYDDLFPDQVTLSESDVSESDAAEEEQLPMGPDELNGPGTRTRPEETVLDFAEGETLLYSGELFSVYVFPAEKRLEGNTYEMDIRCENHTDYTLDFTIDGFAINNWMIDKIWSVNVDPGETYSGTIHIMGSRTHPDIPSADKISFILDVMYNHAGLRSRVFERMFTLFAPGMTEEQIVPPQRTEYKRDIVVFDNERFTMILTGIYDFYEEENVPFAPYKLTFYYENRIDDIVDFSLEEFSINRWSVSPYFDYQLFAGTRGYVEVNLPADMELLNIDEFREICFDLAVESVYDHSKAAYVYSSCSAYPTGLTRNDITDPIREAKEGEKILEDGKDLTIIVEPMSEPVDNERTFCVYVHNKTGNTVFVTLNNFVINNIDNDAMSYGTYVRPGMHSITCVTIEPYRFQADSIDQLVSLGYSLKVIDATKEGDNLLFGMTLSKIY